MQLGSRASKKYYNPNADNQFYSLVTTKIDEEIFKPLFPEEQEERPPKLHPQYSWLCPVLKEGFGCSDEDCVLGIASLTFLPERLSGIQFLTDVTPSIDTYYLFRRRHLKYKERTGIELDAALL